MRGCETNGLLIGAKIVQGMKYDIYEIKNKEKRIRDEKNKTDYDSGGNCSNFDNCSSDKSSRKKIGQL